MIKTRRNNKKKKRRHISHRACMYNIFIKIVLINAECHGCNDFLWLGHAYIFLPMIDRVVNYEDTGRRVDDFVFVQKYTVTVYLCCQTEKKFRF